MTTRVIALLVVAVGCTTEANPLVESPHGEPIPPEVASACELANQRCSHCHPIDRVLRAHISEPSDWRRYVHRMRLMPASGIPPREEPIITRCLVFRVGGAAGLAKLDAETP
jgi:hypothetical protein